MDTPLVHGVISGGQSGVDRGALDAALRRGVPVDGWCPAGRLAEDGPIHESYPLRETPEPRMAQRTSWNVFDSDATLVITDHEPDGGTAYTLDVIRQVGRPCLVATSGPESAPRIRAWLEQFETPPLLNVAGPRESKSPGIANRTRILLDNVLPEQVVERSRWLRVALVTGARGLLGSEVRRWVPPGWRSIGNVRTTEQAEGSSEMRAADLSDTAAVDDLFDAVDPALVIHTAYSYDEAERDVVAATRRVAKAAARRGAALIHCSSDMVFDGQSAPYTEDAEPAALLAYGRAKQRAESLVREHCPDAAILRYSLITRLDPPDPRSEWVLQGLRDGTGPSLFVDEIRTPIGVTDLARCIWEIARIPRADRSGVWHLAGSEALSRYALGLLVAARHGVDPAPLRAARSAEIDQRRPRDLRLSTRRADRHLLTRPRPLSEQILSDF